MATGMTLPKEIVLVNHERRTFRAIFTSVIDAQRGTAQYRVQIPNVEFSLIVVNVTVEAIRDHVRDGKPIPMPMSAE